MGNWINTLAPALNELAWTTRWGTTEKSTALREIRKTDHTRYVRINEILAEDDIEMTDYVPLEYVYDLVDDGPTPEDAACTTETKAIINEALTTLEPRRERLLRGLFGIGCDKMTIKELSDEFLVTKSRIHGLKNNALWKLKHPHMKYARELRSAV